MSSKSVANRKKTKDQKKSVRSKPVKSKVEERKQSTKLKLLGIPPKAMILTSTKEGIKTRIGKGFSKYELKDVGLREDSAKKMNLMVDLRRRSKHQQNIDLLKIGLSLQNK